MTFCSTVHSIVHTGAQPVLVDCNRSTFNIDPELIEKKITPRTKAILVVHMCGRCCDMDPILEIARRHGLRVIEDCAHAIEATYRGQPAGLMGDAGCFSFYPTKNIATCDGGMVITRDPELHERVKVLSLHGMTADAWSRFVGGPSGYEVVAAGFKYNMTDVAAALALPQLACVEEHWQRREQIWQAYNERLGGLPLQLPPTLEPNPAMPIICTLRCFRWRRLACRARRSSPHSMPRTSASASITFPSISSRTIASALDLPIRIFLTRRLSENARSRCRCRPPCRSRTWRTWRLL